MDELTVFHELTLFRDFRSDTPGPSAAETEAARAKLLDAMARPSSPAPRPTSRQHRWAWLGRFARTRFWAPLAAAVAVVAVAITMVLLAVPGTTSTPKPKPSEHQRHHIYHRAHGASKLPDRSGPAGAAGGKHAGTGTAGSATHGAAGSAHGAAGAPGSGTSGAATPTTTTLTVSTGQLSPGQTVTLTATVTAAGNVSGGTVRFYMDPGQNDVYAASSSPLCTHAQLSGNVATCSYTPQSAQTDMVFAAYSGDQQFKESESESAAVTVVESTTTALTISSTQVSPEQTVTLTATVTDQAGDDLSGGTVSFYVDVGQNDVYSAAAEPLCSHVALTYQPATHDNVATCTYTPESAQTDQVWVEYSGYGEYAESGSAVYLTVT